MDEKLDELINTLCQNNYDFGYYDGVDDMRRSSLYEKMASTNRLNLKSYIKSNYTKKEGV